MSNARFSILQARAVKDKRISDSQFRTLAALGMYADQDGWCWPSLQTLANDLSRKKQAVGRDTIALKKLGYLETKSRYNKDGGRRSNLYRLKFDLSPRQPDVDTPSTNQVDAPSTDIVDTPSTPRVDVNDPIKRPKITTQDNETGTAAASQPVLISYESCIGKHTPMIRKLLADAETLYTTEWVIESLQIAAENNVKKWNYCAAILERWHKEGKVDSKKLNSVTSQVSVVSFVDGPVESSELPDDDSETDSMGRNKLWLSLIRDERICKITSGKASGMAFLGIEPVCFDGSEMRVTIKHPERRETMNANLSKVAGRVLSELLGHTARVAFVEGMG